MRQIWKVWRIFWAMLTWTASMRRYLERFPEGGRSRAKADRQKSGCQLLCDILGIEVHLMGERPSSGNYLVVSNHFGVLDPIVLASVLPVSFVAKAEMQKWPFIGWVARSFGALFVNRTRRSTVSQFTEQVQARISEGVDVLVFPEGTTSPDLTILPFKTGAFESIAGNPSQAVLPVYLHVDEVDGRHADGPERKRVVWSDPDLPFLKHCWEVAGIRTIRMEVRLGAPIEVGHRDRKMLAQLANEAVEALRDRERVGPRSAAREPTGRFA